MVYRIPQNLWFLLGGGGVTIRRIKVFLASVGRTVSCRNYYVSHSFS